jgi:hypothetical protein
MTTRSKSKAGTRNPRAVLTRADVHNIRLCARSAAREGLQWGLQTRLAARFGVSRQTICDILAGRSWSG